MTKEQTMSPLRTRMIEDMQLAGLSATTQEVYLQAVTALVKHYRNRSPDQLTEEEVRCYVLAVRQRNARGTFKTCHYGIQFFYRNTLGKDWALFKCNSSNLIRQSLLVSETEPGRGAVLTRAGTATRPPARRRSVNDPRSEDHPSEGRALGIGQAARQCQPSLQDDGL